jgi:exopolysaccharide biosynthesis polyprenyl glycosylphosphotransferase
MAHHVSETEVAVSTTDATPRDTWLQSVARSRALSFLPVVAVAIDLAVISASVAVAGAVRQRWDLVPNDASAAQTISVAGPVIVAIWMLCLVFAGGYAKNFFEMGTAEFRRVATASVAAAGSIGVGCFLLDYPLSREFFFVAVALGTFSLLVGRLALRLLVHRARTTGALQHNVLIVGSRVGVDEVGSVIMRERRLGYRVLGCLTPAGDTACETEAGIPVLGDCDAVTDMVAASGADIVFFANGGVASSEEMRRVAHDLAQDDVHVVVAPRLSGVSGDRVSLRPVGGLPMIHLDPPRATDTARWGKRLLDVVGVLGLLLVILPVVAFAALCIKLHDGGPVFFRQVRVGRDGREFSLLKFRTMVTDAEARLAALHAETGYEGGLFKMVEDPRITKPGRWLRRYSIDELPQLLNILRGDMSMVGPRPPLPHEAATYDDEMARRLHVRPGLTGLWQVSGRSNLSFEEAIRLDLYYVDNWSMFQDFSILTKTVGVVLRPTGAY